MVRTPRTWHMGPIKAWFFLHFYPLVINHGIVNPQIAKMICSMLIKLPCSIAIGYVPLIISQIVNRICSIAMVSRG
jgi:hypothetical protein